jgi:hypothetical protein
MDEQWCARFKAYAAVAVLGAQELPKELGWDAAFEAPTAAPEEVAPGIASFGLAPGSEVGGVLDNSPDATGARLSSIHERAARCTTTAVTAADAFGQDDLDGEAEQADQLEADVNELLDDIDTIGEGGAPVPFAEAFSGHRLALPHAAGNFYGRSAPFHGTTVHYDPWVAGDGLHGRLCSALESKANGHEIYAFEARSLMSALSYQYDLRESLRLEALELADAMLTGVLPASLAHLPERVRDQLLQADAILEHLAERLDVLRQIAFGSVGDVV